MTNNEYLINVSKLDLAALDHKFVVRRNLLIFYIALLILAGIVETLLLTVFFVTYGEINDIWLRIQVASNIVIPIIMGIIVLFGLIDLFKLLKLKKIIKKTKDILKVDKITLLKNPKVD